MIYDSIKNVDNYKGISANMDKALDFLKNMDVDSLTVGKFEIDGSNVFYMVQEYETLPHGECKYETHNNYIDIQLLVSGNEVIRCTPEVTPELMTAYNPDKDVELFYIGEGYDFTLKAGNFVLLMTGELHAPKLMADKQEAVRKVVVKIKK